MMNMRYLIVCAALAGAIVAHAEPILWNVNQQIPDNDETGLQDTQTVSGFENYETIASIEVHLAISALPDNLAYNGDLFVTLLHETGYAVLLNRVGRTADNPLGYDNNGFDITFAVGGNDSHLYQDYSPSYDGSGRLTGTWGVDGRNVDPDQALDTSPRTDMLSSFIGTNPNGNWTLFVADMNRYGNATLNSWGLSITVIPEPATMTFIGFAGMALLIIKRFRG